MSLQEREGEPARRAERMHGRLARALAEGGIPERVRAETLENLGRALLVRVARLGDAHDHRLLHPARTLLVLLDELECREPAALAAAPLVESRFPELGVEGRTEPAAHECSEPASRGADPAPLPLPQWEAGDRAGEADARLLERLVVLPEPSLRLALAEMLDQLRHLHLEPDRGPLMRGIELTGSVYLPLARRLGGMAARRYEWWHRTFSRMVP